MPSKGKAKGAAPEPAVLAVIEEAAPGGAVATIADPPAGPVEGDTAPPVDIVEQPAPPALPTDLEPKDGPLPDRHTPDEAIGALNGLVATGVVDKEQFSQIYLHELGPLGATQDDADRHWDALQEKLQADRAAAEQLAAQMVERATAPPGIAPWNPLSDIEATRERVTWLNSIFNGTVEATRKERTESGSHHHVPGYLKDKIVKKLSAASGLTYGEADAMIHSWAYTSSDHEPCSIALQMAAAQYFGLEPTEYVSKRDKEFTEKSDTYKQSKQVAAKLIDAMYSSTQEWLAEKGIKEVVVWRGMKQSIGTAPEVLDAIKASDAPLQASAHLNPMNSWSANYDMACGFAGPSGYVISARVPASHIVGCCFTGTGCLKEQEFVVLGGKDVQVSAAHLGRVSYPGISAFTWLMG